MQGYGRDRPPKAKSACQYETIDKILNQINFDKILKNSPVPKIKGVNLKDVRTVIEWIKNNRHKHELPIPRCKLNYE